MAEFTISLDVLGVGLAMIPGLCSLYKFKKQSIINKELEICKHQFEEKLQIQKNVSQTSTRNA